MQYKYEEALAVMQPAIAFYRQANNPSTLAMMSIKWGRALHGVGREHEAIDAYQEAIDISSHRSGMEVIESTALVPIAIYYNDRNFHRAAAIIARAVDRPPGRPRHTVVSDVTAARPSGQVCASRYAGLRG